MTDREGKESRGKILNDPVHGHIYMPEYCMEIIDTPQFQRLRDLRQLGASYLVFPGASHHRFEHSVGVGFLARKMMRRIQSKQPELEVEERDIQMVTIAGLCHDLGHGPFSHAFEEWARRIVPDWHHEDMSKRMVEHLITDNQLDYSSEDIRFITDLIGGHSSNPISDLHKTWQYDIVANARNSIDVDKFDYIARDCLNIGIKSSYDFKRLMKYSKVIDGQICFSAKEVYTVYELFHTRYSLFKQVYSHRVSKAIEYMIQDAFTLADDVLHISSRILSPDTFYLVTDSILKEIESSQDPRLEASRKIIRDLRKRKLYVLADEIIVPQDKTHIVKPFSSQSILGHRDHQDEFGEDDIIIHKLTLNYAMQDRNPVDNVSFFSSKDPSTSFSIPKDQVSLLIPDKFSEYIIRIYSRDPSKVDVIRKACRVYASQMRLPQSSLMLSSSGDVSQFFDIREKTLPQ